MKRDEYKAYLQSAAWVRRRQLCLKQYGNRCGVCYSKGPLSVHHRTYERVGNEEVMDLIPLCNGCHELFHGEEKKVDWDSLSRKISERDALRFRIMELEEESGAQ